MTLGFYCENADGALARERRKPTPCVIVFIRPQPGVHQGTGHRLCGASQSWLNCWIKSSFGTEGWDIPSQWPHGFGTGRALCWLAYMIALVRLFFGSLENMDHVHRVIWVLDLESAIAMLFFRILKCHVFLLTFYLNIRGDCCNPSHSFETEWCT